MTSNWDSRGWYAEEDPEVATDYRWRPALQANGWAGELDGIWFQTEQACIDWIKTEILGHGLYGD